MHLAMKVIVLTVYTLFCFSDPTWQLEFNLAMEVIEMSCFDCVYTLHDSRYFNLVMEVSCFDGVYFLLQRPNMTVDNLI
jgi:hypothetical protein